MKPAPPTKSEAPPSVRAEAPPVGAIRTVSPSLGATRAEASPFSAAKLEAPPFGATKTEAPPCGAIRMEPPYFGTSMTGAPSPGAMAPAWFPAVSTPPAMKAEPMVVKTEVKTEQLSEPVLVSAGVGGALDPLAFLR